MRAKEDKQVPAIKVSTLIGGFSVGLALIIGVIGATMAFGEQKSQILANKTAIEVNKHINDKEHTAQSKAINDLTVVLKDFVKVTQKLDVSVEVLKVQIAQMADGQ